MPIHLTRDVSERDPFPPARGYSHSEFNGSDAKCIHIGLINNMPDGALEATERQFLSLLDLAANGFMVRLSLFALPDVPRTEAGRRHISRFYSGIESLLDSHLDGLIVTGTEPQAANLMDEPYWESLTKVLEWAEHNTHSTIWSCLAAHAALLHSDGIGRRRLSEKRFGIFDCTREADDQLTAGVPSSLRVPHSRWNELPEAELADCGYRVLTRANDRTVDAFTRQRKSLFVFFQGHPEYEANTLLLEYRRDVGRYLRQERDTYPPMPEGYFGGDTADILAKLQERAQGNRHNELLANFPTALLEKGIANTWRSAAARLYGNWLVYLWAQKERRSHGRRSWRPLQRPALIARELTSAQAVSPDQAISPDRDQLGPVSECDALPKVGKYSGGIYL
jgi:homoserine O-succinyltransferase